ncbi:hypothetical protein [Teichococcus aestuarii]
MLEDVDLAHWFRAYEPDMAVTAETREITQWRDLKGSGATLRPGTATGMGPARLVEGALNGRPVADHAENGIYVWDGGPAALPQPDFAQPFSLVAQIRVAYPGTGTTYLLSRFNSLSARTLLQINGSANAQTPGSITFIQGNRSVSVPYSWGTEAHIIAACSGTEVALCVNGLWTVPQPTDNAAGTAALALGSLYAATVNGRFAGRSTNLQIWKRYLYGDQRRVSLVQRYFQRLYALPFTPARRPLV